MIAHVEYTHRPRTTPGSNNTASNKMWLDGETASGWGATDTATFDELRALSASAPPTSAAETPAPTGEVIAA